MIKKEVENIVKDAVLSLQKESILPEFNFKDIEVEYPREGEYGDYSTNIAMMIAGNTERNPMDVAEKIAEKIIRGNNKFHKIFKEVSVAEPGFINFFISTEFLHNQIKEVVDKNERFGEVDVGGQKSVNVEFISANPTGPLTLGNGRGGFSGDVLSNVFEKAGFRVTREYYINDVGEQIRKLGHSVLKTEDALYKGEYIDKVGEKVKEEEPEKAGREAADIILEDYIGPTIERMGIKYDIWKRESSLLGRRDDVIEKVKREGLTYEKEGALWLKTSEFGDDKDRVLIKENGEYTYISSDMAYLEDKFDRGYDRIFYLLGADHSGYVRRLKSVAKMLGFDKNKVEIIIMQLVSLFEGEKKVKMSKRAGNYVTLDELMEEVGVDVARFFFLTRGANSHLKFDLEVAKEKSEKNPVYYVKYAHARIASILDKSNEQPNYDNLHLLESEEEKQLIKEIIKFPEMIEDIAKSYEVQRITSYSVDLARAFHKFYNNCQVITKDKDLSRARLALVLAAKIAIKNTLSVLGIDSPDEM